MKDKKKKWQLPPTPATVCGSAEAHGEKDGDLRRVRRRRRQRLRVKSGN